MPPNNFGPYASGKKYGAILDAFGMSNETDPYEVATNPAPSTDGSLFLYDDAIRKNNSKQAVAEQEYNDLLKKAYTPPGELTASQAFGATALAFLPALAGLAIGGDKKYSLGAAGAQIGGAGSNAYLKNTTDAQLYQNQEAKALAGQKANEIAKYDTTNNALQIAGLNQNEQNQRAAESNENRLAIAEARDTERRNAAQQAYLLNVQVLGKEKADEILRIKGGIDLDARGQVSADRLAWSKDQRDIDRASYQLDEYENKTGAPFVDAKTSAMAKPRLLASSALISAIGLLRNALTSGSIEAQRAAATELERTVKDNANAGANFTQMEKDLWFSTIPAFVGNAGTSWWELSRQTALGMDPMRQLAELEKVIKTQTEAEMNGIGLRRRSVPLSAGQGGASVGQVGTPTANGGMSPGTAAVLQAIRSK